ncbi:amino acid ABC transporter permease [Peptostreptococcus faecalis]|uniref:amino acid ABC transporter permease n=1 Tax=Peptostreptococcus faecalis TaxID=2045015 RepID=UPI000C7AE69E|nr:amino acid ABC transporter permease [Peptostreptococcus faecalis]
MDFRLDYFINAFTIILTKLPITLLIAVLSLLLAMLLATFFSVILELKIKILYNVVKIFTSFFRSTPFIAQLFLFYYGAAQVSTFIKDMQPLYAMVLILSLNSSAYMVEIIRGAIQSVDAGQYEAARSLGMTRLLTFRLVIFPQALRVAIPGLSNCFIDLIKGSAVGFTIGVVEMMSQGQIEASRSYRYIEIYLAIVIIYWLVISFFSKIQTLLERKIEIQSSNNKYNS